MIFFGSKQMKQITKTYNYEIDLMLPMQQDKEILFNEAQIKFDSFCNMSVFSFIDEEELMSQKPECTKKYIIKSKNKLMNLNIAYCPNISKGWQFLTPKEYMLVYILSENAFFILDCQQEVMWKKINLK